jgi:lysophospholipase L1-like esterase
MALGYSSVVSLGDSLSDNGNISRFTDGPLWVELLADHYAAPLVDIAYGGATTGYDNPAAGLSFTGLQWQVEQLVSFPADSLITLWAGVNDQLQLRSPFDAVANIDLALENLYLSGGRNFIVPNLPNTGSTPSLAFDPVASEAATFWTLAFNASIEDTLQDFNNLHTDADLFFIDVFTLFEQYPVGTPEWQELFWIDGFHPSSLGHQLIFEAALATVEPIPEPATVLLLGTGIIGIIGSRLRRKKKLSIK